MASQLSSTGTATCEREDWSRAVGLLSGYLCACAVVWPGTDGLSLEEVVSAAYPAAVAAGLVPALAELARLHPELAEVFTSLLRARSQ